MREHPPRAVPEAVVRSADERGSPGRGEREAAPEESFSDLAGAGQLAPFLDERACGSVERPDGAGVAVVARRADEHGLGFFGSGGRVAEARRARLFTAGHLDLLSPARDRACEHPHGAAEAAVAGAADDRPRAVSREREPATEVARADLAGGRELVFSEQHPSAVGVFECPHGAASLVVGGSAYERESAVGGERDGLAEVPFAKLTYAG